jgi:hypothetical protein
MLASMSLFAGYTWSIFWAVSIYPHGVLLSFVEAAGLWSVPREVDRAFGALHIHYPCIDVSYYAAVKHCNYANLQLLHSSTSPR